MADTGKQFEDVVQEQRYTFVAPGRRIVFDQANPPPAPAYEPQGTTAFEALSLLVNQLNTMGKSITHPWRPSIHGFSWEDEVAAYKESVNAAFKAVDAGVTAALDVEKKNIRFSLEETNKSYPTSSQVNKNRRQKNGHRATRPSTVHRSP